MVKDTAGNVAKELDVNIGKNVNIGAGNVSVDTIAVDTSALIDD